ncbi:hypothetical protein Q3G72_000937 [Acer saccharum]|nr:hypothetical protein Q3G72_000937 [Acer saccharum]
MEQQQNYSTKTDAEIQHLGKVVKVSDIIVGYLTEGYCSMARKKSIVGIYLSRSRSKWVNLFLFDFAFDVFLGCFFKFVALMLIDDMFLLVALSNRNPETLRSVLRSRSGKKDPQETLPENPGAASHPPDVKKDPQGFVHFQENLPEELRRRRVRGGRGGGAGVAVSAVRNRVRLCHRTPLCYQ